jgi:hypothetical protein
VPNELTDNDIQIAMLKAKPGLSNAEQVELQARLYVHLPFVAFRPQDILNVLRECVDLLGQVSRANRAYWNKVEEHNLDKNCGNVDNKDACGGCIACLYNIIDEMRSDRQDRMHD